MTLRILTRACLAVFLGAALGAGRANPQDVRTAEPRGDGSADELRWSVWLGSELSSFSGADPGQPAAASLALAQSSVDYRHSHRLRATARLAGFVDTFDRTRAHLRVREAYTSLSAGDWDLVLGKRELRWGTGIAFSVTGALDPPRRPADTSDRLGLNEGRELLGVGWVRGRHALTLVWASKGLFERRNETDLRETWALRHNLLVAGLDLSLVAAREPDGVDSLGGSFSYVIGSRLEVHGELAHRRGTVRNSVPALGEGVTLDDASRWGVVLGAKGTLGWGLVTTGEWYSTDGLLPFGGGRPVVTDSGRIVLSTERRHTLFLGLSKARLRELPRWKEWDLSVFLVADLSGQSFLAGLDLERRLGARWALHGRLLAPGGHKRNTQYGMIPYKSQVSLGLRYQL